MMKARRENMDYSEAQRLIEDTLHEHKRRIVTENTIDAFCKLFPPASAIWQVVSGSREKIDTARGTFTLDIILDMVLAIDRRLGNLDLNTTEQRAFNIMLRGIQATGSVTGLRARTSDSTLRQIFTEREVSIILEDIIAEGDITGLDLTVDTELELKKKLEVKTDFATVKFNPEVGEITFGKGLKSDSDNPDDRML